MNLSPFPVSENRKLIQNFLQSLGYRENVFDGDQIKRVQLAKPQWSC